MPGFTKVTVTGTFTNAKGEPASGTLTFTLTAAMTNTDTTVPPSPVSVTLNGEGHFSVALDATDDTATVPQGVQYGVTEEITGAQARDYFIQVPHATSPVDISTLMPGEPGWT